MSTQTSAAATDKAKEQASEVAEIAKQQTDQVTGQARSKAAEQLDTQSTQAAEQVSSVTGVMKDAGGQLRAQGNQLPAQFVETIAGKADELAAYLRNSDGDKILRDIEDFGRQQPIAVALIGLATGVAAARFVKASSPATPDRSSGGAV